jgi:hypothetical protein
MAKMAAPVATGTSTTTKTTIAIMAAVTTATTAEAVVALLARPPPPTISDGRTNAPWPAYGHPWQGHMTMYPGLMPAGQQCAHAFVATPGLYAFPGLLSGPQQQPLYQQATPAS